jgi:hypothetical protein
MHLIRYLCHIFSEIVESEREAYPSVIQQQLENEVGFFQQKGEIKTGNNSGTSSLSRQLIWFCQT